MLICGTLRARLPGELGEPIELREALLPDIWILDVEPAPGEQLGGRAGARGLEHRDVVAGEPLWIRATACGEAECRQRCVHVLVAVEARDEDVRGVHDAEAFGEAAEDGLLAGQPDLADALRGQRLAGSASRTRLLLEPRHHGGRE